MKQTVNPFEYAGHICQAMKKGILLTTAADGKANTMTIGWGMLGIEWNRPVFLAYVRESRFTRELLEQNGEFTVNIPMEVADPRILSFCGTVSGRDQDKIEALALTLEPSEKISVPGIREFPLTLECRVLSRMRQDPGLLPDAVVQRFYQADESGDRDAHIVYYAEIVDSYIITNTPDG